MYQRKELDVGDLADFYRGLQVVVREIVRGEPDWIANLANVSAVLMDQMEGLNWAGWYLLKEGELVVGPFQGKPACSRIAMGKGVCGTAALRRETVVVPDVHAFPGHIACDGASASEIVVPMICPVRGLLGVLDLDSPRKGRFGEEDARGLEGVVGVVVGESDRVTE